MRLLLGIKMRPIWVIFFCLIFQLSLNSCLTATLKPTNTWNVNFTSQNPLKISDAKSMATKPGYHQDITTGFKLETSGTSTTSTLKADNGIKSYQPSEYPPKGLGFRGLEKLNTKLDTETKTEKFRDITMDVDKENNKKNAMELTSSTSEILDPRHLIKAEQNMIKTKLTQSASANKNKDESFSTLKSEGIPLSTEQSMNNVKLPNLKISENTVGSTEVTPKKEMGTVGHVDDPPSVGIVGTLTGKSTPGYLRNALNLSPSQFSDDESTTDAILIKLIPTENGNKDTPILKGTEDKVQVSKDISNMMHPLQSKGQRIVETNPQKAQAELKETPGIKARGKEFENRKLLPKNSDSQAKFRSMVQQPRINEVTSGATIANTPGVKPRISNSEITVESVQDVAVRSLVTTSVPEPRYRGKDIRTDREMIVSTRPSLKGDSSIKSDRDLPSGPISGRKFEYVPTTGKRLESTPSSIMKYRINDKALDQEKNDNAKPNPAVKLEISGGAEQDQTSPVSAKSFMDTRIKNIQTEGVKKEDVEMNESSKAATKGASHIKSDEGLQSGETLKRKIENVTKNKKTGSLVTLFPDIHNREEDQRNKYSLKDELNIDGDLGSKSAKIPEVTTEDAYWTTAGTWDYKSNNKVAFRKANSGTNSKEEGVVKKDLNLQFRKLSEGKTEETTKFIPVVFIDSLKSTSLPDIHNRSKDKSEVKTNVYNESTLSEELKPGDHGLRKKGYATKATSEMSKEKAKP